MPIAALGTPFAGSAPPPSGTSDPTWESAEYSFRRRHFINQPVAFVRFFQVPVAGGGDENAFSTDFATDTVLAETVPKLICIREIVLPPTQVNPIAGRSEIQTATVKLVDLSREILHYIADPAQPLDTAWSNQGTTRRVRAGAVVACAESGVGLGLKIRDARGYPARGHVTIDTEDVRYTAKVLGIGTTRRKAKAATWVAGTGVVAPIPHRLLGLKTAQRGTAAATHLKGALVRNGEQIRKSNRMAINLGYAPLPESEYGPGIGSFAKLEIVDVTSEDHGLTWVVRGSDIQRFAKRKVFETASSTTPFEIGPDHPITIALKVLTSTGAGTNGAYDVLPAEWGGAIAASLIDVAALEALRTRLANNSAGQAIQVQFREIEPADLKDFVETQCFRPLNLIPVVNRQGQYSAAYLRPPVLARATVTMQRRHLAVA